MAIAPFTIAPASPWRSTLTLMPVAFVNASSTGFEAANASCVSSLTVVPRSDAGAAVDAGFADEDDDDEPHAASTPTAVVIATTVIVRRDRRVIELPLAHC